MDGLKRFLFVFDWLISRGLRKLFDCVVHITLLAIGASTFFISLRLTSEYGEGLSDISRLEWLYFALAALLIWRYCKQLSEAGQEDWMVYRTPFLLTGKLCLMSFPFVVVFFAEATEGMSDDAAIIPSWQSNDFQLIVMGITVLGLYLSAPVYPKPLWEWEDVAEKGEFMDIPKAEPESCEPSSSQAQQEASIKAETVATVHPNGDIELPENRTP